MLKSCSVDAKKESERLGQLINHSRRKPNCIPKTVELKGTPYLYFVASRVIEVGEELSFDYEERRKDILTCHPWLQE